MIDGNQAHQLPKALIPEPFPSAKKIAASISELGCVHARLNERFIIRSVRSSTAILADSSFSSAPELAYEGMHSDGSTGFMPNWLHDEERELTRHRCFLHSSHGGYSNTVLRIALSFCLKLEEEPSNPTIFPASLYPLLRSFCRRQERGCRADCRAHLRMGRAEARSRKIHCCPKFLKHVCLQQPPTVLLVPRFC